MHWRRVFTIFLSLLLLVPSWSFATQHPASVQAATLPHYIMTDIGVLPGDTYSLPSDISDLGQVVGGSYSTASSHTFLFSNGLLTNLGSLGVNNINNSGLMVGTSG